MNFKKRVNGSWTDTPHYIHNTSTDTLTTLPADIYANAATATVGLKGNMSQSGTPTPQNPIQPSECGDLETTGEHAGQYKIPISSASTTTPVYLGEVETTRQIKKLVLTGNERLINEGLSAGFYRYRVYLTQLCDAGVDDILSSHYPTAKVTNPNSEAIAKPLTVSQFVRFYSSISSIDGFKSYLAAQYAAGTPVTVWYVLATPTTGIVNEPIRKIGDYADTVSGITIPTIAGADTFDVLTTLKPSEVSLAYTGWHDAEVKEWDGSEWQ